jgi:hypothetical protein
MTPQKPKVARVNVTLRDPSSQNKAICGTLYETTPEKVAARLGIKARAKNKKTTA